MPNPVKLRLPLFHTVGNTGGIEHGDFQVHVANAMKKDLKPTPGEGPSFLYRNEVRLRLSRWISEIHPLQRR